MIDCVVLETENGLVVDVTDSKNGRVWKVVSDESGVCVEEVKPTQGVKCPPRPLLPPRSDAPIPVLEVNAEDGEATVVTNRFVIPPPAMSFAVSTPEPVVGSGIPSLLLPAVAERPTVDIMVAYDSDAANWANSNGGGIQAFAETAVQKMNTAIANTGLDAKFSFRLVGVYEIGGSAGGSLDYAVKFASGEIAGTLNGVSWAGVAQKRDEVRADVVCVLADTGSSSGTTGLGYSLTAGTADPAGCGYNACAIRAVAQSHTMTHEVGHNMGAGHSDQMADESNRGPQYHSYSSGYYFYVDGVGYYTIMAYNADGYGNYYTEVPYFSSPDYIYRGKAVGDATHNNSKTISLTYSTIVNNRRTPVVSADVGIGLDAEDYEWTTDGSYPWARTTDRSADHVDSASSCLTPANPGITSWAETQVVGPATLSFSYFFVSYGGQFLVTCDGTQLFSYGSSSQAIQMVNWSTASNLSIPSGTHTVRFAHINNNSSFYSPANAVWVDKVVFAGGTPPNTEYTISFNANGGSSAPSAITRKGGAEYGELPTLTRTGYTFDGWYTAPTGGTKVTATTKATGNVMLYAHWTAVKYAITYNLDGGSNASSNPATYTVEDAVTLAAPTRSGYTFSGWTPNDGKIAKGSTGAKTFTATWMKNVVVKYTISFNANGGSSAPAAITREEGAEYGELPTVTRTGYTFDGWYTAATGGTKVTATTKATGDVMLYAHWNATAVADLVHRWSFNGNLTDSVGGQSAKIVGSATSNGKQYTLPGGSCGSSYIDLGSDVLPKTSKAVTIEIWATQISAQYYSRIFSFGGSGGNLYMEWTLANFLNEDEVWFGGINFGGRGSKLAPYSLGTEYHISVVMTEGNDGVWTAKYYKKSIQTGETLATYTARGSDAWSLKNQDLSKCYLGQAVNGSSENTANASYNEVRIWSCALTEDELSASAKAGPDVLPGGTEIRSYTITFDANGGSSTPAAITRDEGSEYGELPTVTRTGYTFDDWYTAASGGTKVTATTKVTGDVTLYAHWVSSPSGAGNVSVTSVIAQQRYPVDGLVDITVTIQGAADDVAEAECLFAATNGATKAAILVVHITRNGDGTGSGNTWTRKFIWDAKADVGAVKIDDVALTVAIKGTTSVEGGVQLWENGPYWAECNVGASQPEESGYYFWWGDTVGYKRNANNDGWVSVKDSTSYSFGDCPTYGKDNSQLQSEGYIDVTGNLVAKYDAATAHLEAPWRMPTDAEFSALINNCDTEWTSRNGVSGRLLKGRGAYASKSIFFPAAGYGYGSLLGGLGLDGAYWSSALYSGSSVDAWGLSFYSGFFGRSGDYRKYACSVRPVREFANTSVAIGGVTTHFSLGCCEVTISFDAQGGSPMPSAITLYEGCEYGELPTVTRTGYTFDGWYTAASGGTKVMATTKVTGDATLYAHWVSSPSGAGNVSLTSVTAQPRYPWNGLVDITVMIQGSAEDVVEAGCAFVATNSATKTAIPVEHITWDGVDARSGDIWTRKFIWDAKTDIGAVRIDDVALTVNAKILLEGVQLWENGPYWAERNVGASQPEEYGYYFWWGDTVGYKRNVSDTGWISAKDSRRYSFDDCPTYGKDNSQLQSMGYIDATGNLVAAHDAATAHWGAPWRMPTDAEFSALINNCKTTWTTRNGEYGRLVTGKGVYASKSIFLPFAGNGYHSDDLGRGGSGGTGLYWSSTLYPGISYYAWCLGFDLRNFALDGSHRLYGQSVRPVRMRGFANPSAATGGVTTHFVVNCREVTISFNAQGGSPTPLSTTLYEGSEYGGLPTVTRTGYTFDGWYTAATGGTKVTATTKATGDATLYAHWTAVKYAITYNLDGGKNASSNPATYTVEDAVTLAAPTRSGYTFSGWTPNDGKIAKGSTGAKTFTAIWTMDEVFEVNNDGDREYSVGEDVGWDCNLFVVETSSAVAVSVTGLPDGLGYRTEVDDNEVLVYFTGRAVRAGRYRVVCIATDEDGRSVSDSIWVEIIESVDAAFDYVDNWDGTITLMRYRGESVPEQLVIPSEYDGKKVTGVGLLQLRTQEEWDKYDGISFFGENEDERIVIGSKLKSVKLPEGLVTIGINSPFAYQSGITSVEFPSTLKNIGDWAFCCCTGLKSVDLSGTALENCLWSSFAGCKAMTEVKFPSTLTTLGGLSFAWCRALKSVTFEGNAPTIQNYTSDGGRDGAKWGDWAGRIYVDSGFDFRSFDTQRSNTRYLAGITTYVKSGSSGWGAVPGTWQGSYIDYVDRREEPDPGDDESPIRCNIKPEYRTKADVGVIPVRVVNVGEAVKIAVKGLPSGVKFTAKDVKATVKSAAVPANSIYGAPTKSGVYAATVTVTPTNRKSKMAPIVKGLLFIVRNPGEHVVVANCDAAQGTVKGMGVYASGKKVTLKATAAKEWVFSGWYDGDTLVSRLASYVLTMPEVDVNLTARFVTAAEDAKSIALTVTAGETDIVQTKSITVKQGMYVEWPVAASALSATTVKVSGLPSGLKFTAKDVMKKGSKTEVDVPANTIYGTPKTASKVDKNGNVTPSKVKITVTTAGKQKQEYIINVTVRGIPAEGTFNGGGANGLVTLTVAKTGKISGKYLADGKTWTLSASGFDTWDDNDRMTATLTAKSGKEVETVELVYEYDCLWSSLFEVMRNEWKVEPQKSLATKLKGQKVQDGEVALTVGANGTVAAKGAFDGLDGNAYSASCSTVLIPLGDNDYAVYLYFPPKVGKFVGLSKAVILHWNGAAFSVKGLPAPLFWVSI